LAFPRQVQCVRAGTAAVERDGLNGGPAAWRIDPGSLFPW
jgi:hypothetical protein